LTFQDQIPERGKNPALTLLVQERQAGNSDARNADLVGGIEEVNVEARYEASNQWMDRTTRNRTIAFHARWRFARTQGRQAKLIGTYLNIRVTRAGPSSLSGESVAAR